PGRIRHAWRSRRGDGGCPPWYAGLDQSAARNVRGADGRLDALPFHVAAERIDVSARALELRIELQCLAIEFQRSRFVAVILHHSAELEQSRKLSRIEQNDV